MRFLAPLLKDPWFVLSAVLAATSGGAMAAKGRLARAGPASPPASSSPSRAPAGSAASGPAGGAPTIQGGGFTRILQARTPGRWIVDSARAKDSDTDSLADALANAKDGDTILLRPGTYAGGVRIEASLAILGQPAGGQAPVIAGDGKADTLELGRGTLRLEDLAIRQAPGGRYAVTARAGALALKRVSVESESQYGFYNRGADVAAEASSFRAREYGLEHRGGTLVCKACVISGSGKQGLSVGPDALKTHLIDARVLDNGSGGGVSLSGPAILERSVISRNKGAGVRVGSGVTGPVRLSDCQVTENVRAGINVGGGSVLAERVQADRNRNVGLQAMGSARVKLVGFSARENGNDGLFVSDGAQLELQGGELKANVQEGLYAGGSAHVKLGGCVVAGNGYRGVWATGDSRVEIDGCEFSANRRGDYDSGDRAAITGRSVPPIPAPRGAAPPKRR